MANKKEPPFFNEDNLGAFHYKLPFYDTMELFIETLTGTCFELRVSPFETLISVKAKIQRLEGIPVSQQHLIWNNMELEDDYCLNDYSISEGCTLKLVLAMRGGPINTRRVPVEDSMRDMTEYMDPSRNDLWEKVPSNKQVTFLVYREGDQLNFFRVIDRGDGTLTPLSESLSGGSVYNLYAEDDEEIEASPSGQQIIENSITMNKMRLLKNKMENMNLSKKPKKTAKVKPRPPLTARPASGSMAAVRHRLLRVLPHIGQTCLPPLSNPNPSESSQNALSALTTLATPSRTMTSLSGDYVPEEESCESPTLSPPFSTIKLPPKISRVELESGPIPRSSIFPPVAHLPKTWESSEQMNSMTELDPFMHLDFLSRDLHSAEKESASTTAEMFSFLAETSPAELCGAGRGNPNLALKDGSTDSSTEDWQQKISAKAVRSESMETGIFNSQELSPSRSKVLSSLHCPQQLAHNPLKPARQPKCLELRSLRPATSQSMLPSLEVRSIADSSFSRTTRLRGVKVDSPGKRPDIISKIEARDITEMANKASKEPMGSVNNLGFLASLARSTSRENLQNSCGTSRLQASALGLSTPLQHLQEEGFSKVIPPRETAELYISTHGHGINGTSGAPGRRVAHRNRKQTAKCAASERNRRQSETVAETQEHCVAREGTLILPPMKAPIQAKKKTSKHCFLCGKKTGLATSYECRKSKYAVNAPDEVSIETRGVSGRIFELLLERLTVQKRPQNDKCLLLVTD
ncbi:AN1-type zinc finger protein 4 isoform X3 [Rhinatrema bivittatum]|uniref:AN1-type zinc finger protein 4 isoform X3 n=1 Tax=Rhinatrema bivittatum TaxID=194408 RepID=UPI0011262434|nr:AN1-type zinc finger protein 4 isoform X3 [Rhinatrema bivittatum]